MGNSGTKQHIETAKKTGVLKLSQAKLIDLPPGLQELEPTLRTLDLSENKFSRLPNEIGRFMNIRHLNLKENKLTKLPDSIGALTKLETFNASYNMLTTIPRTISNLIHLKQVILTNNKLDEFPAPLYGLKHLDMVDLQSNCIKTIPPGISSLYCVELNLNQNRISQFDEEIGQCPRLRTLRLEENCISLNGIPENIFSFSEISNISLDGNCFNTKDLPSIKGYDKYMERYTAVKKKLY